MQIQYSQVKTYIISLVTNKEVFTQEIKYMNKNLVLVLLSIYFHIIRLIEFTGWYFILNENDNFKKYRKLHAAFFLTKTGIKEFLGTDTWCRYCCLMIASSLEKKF